MWTALKGLFSSKTMWLAIIGSAVLAALAFILPTAGLGPEMVDQVMLFVAGLFGLKGTQQALADIGKNKS
jgi:hypothetical protein